MKKKMLYAMGLCTGFINAVLGAGGGMLVVPTLKSNELDQKEAQATAIAVILPLTLISATVYLMRGNVELSQSYIYLPFGLMGALIGAWLLNKISNRALNIVFSLFLLWSAVRMFFR